MAPFKADMDMVAYCLFTTTTTLYANDNTLLTV